MKIFCIGRNYTEHVHELNNEMPQNPVVFCKPLTALLLRGQPFYYPDFSTDIHYEGELVIQICKNGKNVEPRFAHLYYDKITVGIDFTARDLQTELKNKGLPWEIAKGFNGSAPLGQFIPIAEAQQPNGDIAFSLHKNGQAVQNGNTNNLLFSFNAIICYLSKYFVLQQSDIIFTGTSAGVGPIAIGDLYEGFIGNKKLLKCAIK